LVTPNPHIPNSPDEGNAVIGVYLGEAKSISYDTFLEKVLSGPLHSYNMLAYSVSSLAKIIGISVETKDMEPISSSMTGPVGLFNILGSIIDDVESKKVLTLIDTVAIISLGFAFTNILPIPALDGGRVVFRIYEGVTKRKVDPNIESKVHSIGMMLPLILVVMITFKDIRVW